ncbi:hypothetical protein evm_005904 [Chilo suppressalis]|nr:hypothetical protein evm_005904 [Chilo suppressalis]
MGMINSKDLRRNEATSNTSLSKLRYVITEKPKWKVFKKREVTAIPTYRTSFKPTRGCPCGNSSPCKQKVTPRGVTIHYPQKKPRFTSFSRRTFKSAKIEKGFVNPNNNNYTVNMSFNLDKLIPNFKMPNIKLPKSLSMPKSLSLPKSLKLPKSLSAIKNLKMPKILLPTKKPQRDVGRDMFLPMFFK